MLRWAIPTSVLLVILLLSILAGCIKTAPASSLGGGDVSALLPPTAIVAPAGGQPHGGLATAVPAATFVPPTREPGAPILSPTPDTARAIPTPRLEEQQYVIQAGDSLGRIAEQYGISLNALIEANNLPNADWVDVGQALTIPAPPPLPTGSSFKIIPDSELVYGPALAGFDVKAYVNSRGGYLSQYYEEAEGETLSGAEIVQRVAENFSVSPRLLLTVLEYQSNWVTASNPSADFHDYPMGYYDSRRVGLYRQLSWAANELSRGYYLWRAEGLYQYVLTDGNVVPVSPTLNAGTAGVQYMAALLNGYDAWNNAIGSEGIFRTFSNMFGYPFDFAFEPLIPANLQQPEMRLPFEDGVAWSFTGGPHGGWGDGSSWGALDFAPPGEPLGCVANDGWDVASAPGLILRAHNGAVIQDLDGDGSETTGWVLLYMHVETRDRVQPGTYLQAGDRIGHPSCEGGYSTGTHLHIARKYNGEWIAADGPLPFNLDGWVSSGNGLEYDGYLVRNEQTIEAYNGRSEKNQIQR